MMFSGSPLKSDIFKMTVTSRNLKADMERDTQVYRGKRYTLVYHVRSGWSDRLVVGGLMVGEWVV